MKAFPLPLAVALLAVGGCDTGYKDIHGAPAYVTWDEAHGRREWPIQGVDAATFEVLRADAFARDKSTVYFKWHPIPNADPKTFRPLTDLYARDDRRAFFETRVIEGAHPATFAPFEVQWARDRHDVYLQYLPQNVCDAPTFELLAA